MQADHPAWNLVLIAEFEFYVIPAAVMSRETKEMHQRCLDTPGEDGKPRKEMTVRGAIYPTSLKPVFVKFQHL